MLREEGYTIRGVQKVLDANKDNVVSLPRKSGTLKKATNKLETKVDTLKDLRAELLSLRQMLPD